MWEHEILGIDFSHLFKAKRVNKLAEPDGDGKHTADLIKSKEFQMSKLR